MKSLKKINEEYRKYHTDLVIPSLEEFIEHLDAERDTLVFLRNDYLLEKAENTRWKLSGQIRNFFFFIFEEEEVAFYDKDNSIIDEGLNFIDCFIGYLHSIQNISTSDNYQELLRLLEFSSLYFNEYLQFINDKRKMLEYSYNGICYSLKDFFPKVDDFQVFFREELNKYRIRKGVEKVKRLW